jgi:peroxiredoxin
MKLKSLLLFSIFIVVLSSCSNTASRFVIIGNITGMPEQNVVLEQIYANDVIAVLDSGKSNASGHFEFTENATEPGLYRLHFKNQKFILLTLDKGNVKVISDWNNISNYNILGSPSSESLKNLLATYRNKVRDFNTLYIAIDTLKVRGNDSILQVARKDLEEMKISFTRYIENYADTTPYLPNAVFAARMLNPANEGQFLDVFAKNILTKFPGTKMAKDFSDYYIKVSTKTVVQKRAAGSFNVGDMVPEVNLPTANGNFVALSSLRGNFVLLDFWASFCPPCRADNPKIVAAYKKYKGKRFEIYGVSLDDNKSNWEKAIQTDNLDWVQVSDMKRWESPVVKQFGIEAIPSNFLIDPTGKIVAKNIEGGKLEEILEKNIK